MYIPILNYINKLDLRFQLYNQRSRDIEELNLMNMICNQTVQPYT